ncbi:MAG: SHOCT domain-containing protein [Catenulispora sp.]|nr:SHOCT domain-containing protein [Catenulispora sp.]
MSHPLLNAFWMMLWFFLWIMWFMLLFRVISDVFGDEALSGWGKAGWTIFVCVLPFLGVFIYLIVRGKQMTQRSMARAQARQDEFDNRVREAAATSGPGGGPGGTGGADELAKLADLKTSGVLSEDEFQQAKQKILA